MVSIHLPVRPKDGELVICVLNVNVSLDPKRGGGEAERTYQMSRFLARQGARCNVLTLDTGLDQARIRSISPAVVVAFPCLWRRFHIPRLRWSIVRRLVEDADVVHLVGHWTLLNAIVYIALRRTGKPYVVCPAGALPLFGRSRWLKRLYNFLVGRALVQNASAWVAVTKGEFPQFEGYGIPASKVTVIPNGVCSEDFPPADKEAFLRKHGLPDAPMILFMGRLNLIKGPDLLLQAFLGVRDRLPDHHLVFAGPDGGMLSELRKMTMEAGSPERIHFLGYVDGADKSAAYRLAKLLVVPSRQEAMSIVALEAGICGTPALLTDQCGFDEVRSVDLRLEVPCSVDGLAKGMLTLLGDPAVLERIAPAWRGFIEQHYAWDAVVHKYFDLYRDILENRATK
jgi:glycosyltransferase involved in cell wall biosynthesis